jgi:hypothetical protein
VAAMERDELLRTARGVMIWEKVDPQRLVFVDEMGANISFLLCAHGRVEGNGVQLGTAQPLGDWPA